MRTQLYDRLILFMIMRHFSDEMSFDGRSATAYSTDNTGLRPRLFEH